MCGSANDLEKVDDEGTGSHPAPNVTQCDLGLQGYGCWLMFMNHGHPLHFKLVFHPVAHNHGAIFTVSNEQDRNVNCHIGFISRNMEMVDNGLVKQ